MTLIHMKRRLTRQIRAAAWGALVLMLATGSGAPMASEPQRVPEPPSAWREVSVGVGLNMKATAISLDGFLYYGGKGQAPVQPAVAVVLRAAVDGRGRADLNTSRLRSIEIISAPNVHDCVRRLTAVARVTRSVSRNVVRQWWRRFAGTPPDEGR